MAEKKYFVNNGHSNAGPFEMSTVIEKVAKGEFKATDHICVDSNKDEWILICQHPEFLKHYSAKPNKPTIVPRAVLDENSSPGSNVLEMTSGGQREYSVATAHTGTAMRMPVPESSRDGSGDLTQGEWYVLKGRNRFGPFTYTDVIRMLQDKSIFEFDYVWCQGLDTWKRVAQIPCFSVGNIRALFDTDGGVAEEKVFVRRNYKRVKYETTVIAHDNKSVWKGKTYEVSEGGAGIVIQNAMILPGHNVYVHFSPGAMSKPFNVFCEVVNKRYMGGLRDAASPVIYGIKFINITKQDREALREINPAAA